jgi:hypothetical protein
VEGSVVGQTGDVDHRGKLLEMIRRLLDRRWSFDEFADAFWNYYLKEVPPGVLPERDDTFFEAVQEHIDFTKERPDSEERCEQGYKTPKEFVKWLRARMDEYDGGKELDLDWWA